MNQPNPHGQRTRVRTSNSKAMAERRPPPGNLQGRLMADKRLCPAEETDMKENRESSLVFSPTGAIENGTPKADR